jgi:hypothetical protein
MLKLGYNKYGTVSTNAAKEVTLTLPKSLKEVTGVISLPA